MIILIVVSHSTTLIGVNTKTQHMKHNYYMSVMILIVCLFTIVQPALCITPSASESAEHTSAIITTTTSNQLTGEQMAVNPKKGKKHKWLKALRKHFKKAMKKEDEKSNAGKILLLLLLATVLAAGVFLLAFIILWNSSGSFVLPLVLLLLGYTGIAAWMNHLLKKVLPDETKGKRTLYAILLTLGGISLMVLFSRIFAG